MITVNKIDHVTRMEKLPPSSNCFRNYISVFFNIFDYLFIYTVITYFLCVTMIATSELNTSLCLHIHKHTRQRVNKDVVYYGKLTHTTAFYSSD